MVRWTGAYQAKAPVGPLSCSDMVRSRVSAAITVDLLLPSFQLLAEAWGR